MPKVMMLIYLKKKYSRYKKLTKCPITVIRQHELEETESNLGIWPKSFPKYFQVREVHKGCFYGHSCCTLSEKPVCTLEQSTIPSFQNVKVHKGSLF